MSDGCSKHKYKADAIHCETCAAWASAEYNQKRAEMAEAEIERIKRNHGQGSTQFCHEAMDAHKEADSLRADAALGRAVRNFREGMALFRQNPEWAFRQGYSGDIIRCDTPEAALQAAGLMEVKG